MKNSMLFRFSILGFFLALFSLLPACDDNFDRNLGDGSSTGLKLEITQQPQVTWLSSNGKTQVILQFSVRDSSGAPLTEDQIVVQLILDGNPIDVESMLNQSSTELEVNLYFAMVLDASFSMTQHNPPAFEPMKTASRDSYQQVLDLWNTRPGAVKFSLIWFDEVMNQSAYNINHDWVPDDILSIPEPFAGTATKLDSAVKVMADYLQSEYDNGIFNGARDQYVMLVFSDGADNYSYWDNTLTNPNRTLSTTSGASYAQYGTLPTTLDAAKSAVAAHPRLTSHVIGLGSAINASELTQIAQAGNGTFQANPSSQNIGELFQRVLNEFTTILARGAEIPLPPGDYEFTLSVKNKAGGSPVSHKFMMHAGDPQAGVISTP